MKVRKARKQYQCTERSYHVIRAGDQYLHAVMTPWHECNDGNKYVVLRACLRCAEEYGMHTSETKGQVQA